MRYNLAHKVKHLSNNTHSNYHFGDFSYIFIMLFYKISSKISGNSQKFKPLIRCTYKIIQIAGYLSYINETMDFRDKTFFVTFLFIKIMF